MRLTFCPNVAEFQVGMVPL